LILVHDEAVGAVRELSGIQRGSLLLRMTRRIPSRNWVKLGLGISLLPLWSVSEDAGRGTVRTLRLANRQLFSTTGPIYRKSAHLPPALRALVAVAHDLPRSADVLPVDNEAASRYRAL
jgi:DNA-binding transcriptional LysR family regulator